MVWPARRMLTVDRRVWRASSSNRRSVKRQNCHEPVLPADTGAAHATALGAHLRGHPNLSGSRAVRFRSRVRSAGEAELANRAAGREDASPPASRVGTQPIRSELTRVRPNRAAYPSHGGPVPAPCRSLRRASALFGRGASAGLCATRLRQPPPARALGVTPP